MVAPEKMISVGSQHALQDMVELKMYLVSQTGQAPWPMLPRTRTSSLEASKAHRNSVELGAVWELLDLGFIEATSSRTFVVSKSGYQCYQRTISPLSA
jgi:hypothetical protein